MIRHVVIWRLKEDAKPAGQIKDIELIRHIVAGLRDVIPGLLRLDLGINQLAIPDSADLLLYSEFESWQSLQEYEEHPLHSNLRALIGPLRAERRVVNYETS